MDEDPTPKIDPTSLPDRAPSQFPIGLRNAAAIYSTQLPQATVVLTEPCTEGPRGHNSDQSHWECNNDDFNPHFVWVVMHNLSQGGTIQEESDVSDRSANWRGTDTSRLTTL